MISECTRGRLLRIRIERPSSKYILEKTRPCGQNMIKISVRLYRPLGNTTYKEEKLTSRTSYIKLPVYAILSVLWWLRTPCNTHFFITNDKAHRSRGVKT